jgi:signal-transduction protein with cAMP-binding, CBS, and nucleotidyltransferase domain
MWANGKAADMHTAGTVDSILSQKPPALWSVDPDATVFEAIKMLADKNIGALLVMRAGQLHGVFSERDYTRKVILKGKSSKETPVHDVISSPAITVEPCETVEGCMRLMTENRVRHLPVLDGEKVVGIVSIGDLVNWTISAQSHALNQMQDYISGKYPG